MDEKGRSEATSRIITVAGCKGGVGKSMLASAIALEAGRAGIDVILVDADLGGANLHTYLGMQAPEYVISDFISRRVDTIEQIVLETRYEGVRFISGAGNTPSQANLKFAQKTKIIKSLFSLTADLLIIDIGAGSSYDVMDFFSMTDGGVIVATPEPTSIINSYGFMKNVVYRRFNNAFRRNSLVTEVIRRGMNPGADDGISDMDELLNEIAIINSEMSLEAKSILSSFTPNIIMNRTASQSDGRLGEKLKSIIGTHLSIEARFLGEVPDDLAVRLSARKMIPFTVFAPDCEATRHVRKIADRLFQRESSIPQTVPLETQPA